MSEAHPALIDHWVSCELRRAETVLKISVVVILKEGFDNSSPAVPSFDTTSTIDIHSVVFTDCTLQSVSYQKKACVGWC